MSVAADAGRRRAEVLHGAFVLVVWTACLAFCVASWALVFALLVRVVAWVAS